MRSRVDTAPASSTSLAGRVASRLPDGIRAWARRRREAARAAAVADMPEARVLFNTVAAVPHWGHSIDLGMGVVTPGIKTPAVHERELAAFRLPDLRGKSVLDIGAWDGFYSFAAERLGAARVVALDHHIWGLDREVWNRYRADCRKRGIPQEHPRQIPSLWNFDALPGRRGFELAHATLHSRVEAVVCDVMRLDAGTIGLFDVVLYLGVLYHLDDPLESLRRVRSVTKSLAVIETEAIAIGGCESRPLCEFFPPGAKLANDPTNFWAPNAAALVGLCDQAGFERVDVLTTPPKPRRGQLARYRLVAHAFVQRR